MACTLFLVPVPFGHISPNEIHDCEVAINSVECLARQRRGDLKAAVLLYPDGAFSVHERSAIHLKKASAIDLWGVIRAMCLALGRQSKGQRGDAERSQNIPRFAHKHYFRTYSRPFQTQVTASLSLRFLVPFV